MADTGWLNPTTATTSGLPKWVDPTNIFFSDRARASAGGSDEGATIIAGGFGIPFVFPALSGQYLVFTAISCRILAAPTVSGSVVLGVRLSWDGESTSTSVQKTETWAAPGEVYKTVFIFEPVIENQQAWGRRWNEKELVDGNFFAEMELLASPPFGSLVNNLQIMVTYHLARENGAGSLTYDEDEILMG